MTPQAKTAGAMLRPPSLGRTMRSLLQLGRDLGDVLALEARHAEFLLTRLAAAVRAGDGRGAVRRAALDLIQTHLRLTGIGQAHDDHAVMQQNGVEAGD